MQVGTLSVQHIFEKDILYTVPLYQRPYVWTEAEQWVPLWEDIQALANGVAEGRTTRAHFMGASVQDKPSVAPGHIETRTIIDGQQRLTTLQLLLKAFHDVVVQRGNDPYARAIEKLVRNNHPLSTLPHQQFKIWPTNADRDDLRAVMEAKDRAGLLSELGAKRDARRVGRAIPDAYLYFTDAIEAWLAEDAATADARLAGLYGAIRDNVRIVVIDLDEKDDAQMIFETLNARGTPLLSADLVKNALLNEVQQQCGDVAAAYEKYWQRFDTDAAFWRKQVGRGHAQRARIETLLQHTISLMSGTTVSASHLYAAYRDFAQSDRAGSAIDRLAQFRSYGTIFKRLQEPHPDARTDTFFERLRVLDVVTAWPFLLALFKRFEDVPDVIDKVLTDLDSFLIRRMVCRLSTRGYGEVFAALTLALPDEAALAPAAINAALSAGTAEADRWPGDDEFRVAWVGNPLYENLTRPRLRLLLEAVEAGLRNHFAETKAVPRNLTIEHVLPQGWREHWASPTAMTPEGRDRLLHRIGNLTLLNDKLNPHQSNRPWQDLQGSNGDLKPGKRSALNDYTVLWLNKELVAFDQWDDDCIERRSDHLFEVAKRVWPKDRR